MDFLGRCKFLVESYLAFYIDDDDAGQTLDTIILDDIRVSSHEYGEWKFVSFRIGLHFTLSVNGIHRKDLHLPIVIIFVYFYKVRKLRTAFLSP